MLVRDTSEFALIDLMAAAFEAGGTAAPQSEERLGYRLLQGIGDDAAVWDAPAGPMVAATDTMVEGVHFRLGTTTWDSLGWKAMAVNLSDIAAMGCEPLYALVTVGLRGDIPVAGLESMCSGMAEAGRAYGCAVVGGDTVSSPVLFVTVAVTGAPPDGGDSPLLSRSAAVPGDVVAVTGSLGCSAAGLRMRQENICLPDDVSPHLSAAHDRPVPRVPEAVALARAGVRAAIDVSDGLADDLGKLCRASGVGAVLYAGRVPVDAFLRADYPADAVEMALAGGEDYELLFTAPEDVVLRAEREIDTPIAIIGEIVEEPRGVRVLDASGRPMKLRSAGWDHFRAHGSGSG